MIKAMNNTPAILATLFVLVCLALIGTEGYTYYQASKTDPYPSRPAEKFNTDKDDLYPSKETGQPLLINQTELKESFNSREKEMDLDEFMKKETIIESPLAQTSKDPFLIIAGTYADETMIISKQAQMERLGLNAEIIQIKGANHWNLCVGRFDNQIAAASYSNKLKKMHDIKAFVYEKK